MDISCRLLAGTGCMCWRDAFGSAADVIFNTIMNALSLGQENNEKVRKYWIPRRLGWEDQFKAEQHLFLKNSFTRMGWAAMQR